MGSPYNKNYSRGRGYGRFSMDSQSQYNSEIPQYNNSDNFLPLGFSSPMQNQQNFDRNNQFNSFSGHKQQQWNSNFSGNKKFHNRPSFNNSRHYQNDRSNYGNNQYNRRSYNQTFNSKQNIDISEYFHPSMLEDPWIELLQKNDKNPTENVVNKNEEKEEITTVTEDSCKNLQFASKIEESEIVRNSSDSND